MATVQEITNNLLEEVKKKGKGDPSSAVSPEVRHGMETSAEAPSAQADQTVADLEKYAEATDDLRASVADSTASTTEAAQSEQVRAPNAVIASEVSAGDATTMSAASAGEAERAASKGYDATTGTAQGYDATQAQKEALANAQQMQAANIQGGGVSTRQDQLLQALAAQAMGQGPSVAKLQAEQSREAAMKQQMSMLASQRGEGSAGLAQREAAQNVATTNQQINRDAMQARIQEQQQAQGLASQAFAQNRGQNIQLGQSQAQLQQQAGMQNMQAANQFSLQQGQMNQATNLANMQAMNQAGQFGAQQANQMSLANMQAQNQAGQFGAQAFNQAALQNASQANQMAQYNAGMQQQAGMQNMQAQNQMSQYNAGLLQNRNLAVMDAQNQMSQFGAGLQQQTNLANAGFQQQAGMFNTGQQNQFQQNQWGAQAGLIGQGAGMSMNQFGVAGSQADRMLGMYGQLGQWDLGYDQMGLDRYLGNQQLDMQNRGQNMELIGAGIGALGSLGAAGIAAASDVRVKENFSDAKPMNNKLLQALASSAEYSYKSGYGEDTNKRYVGPMANDLPESMTTDMDGVKGIDISRFALGLGSVVSQQQEELEELRATIANKKKS